MTKFDEKAFRELDRKYTLNEDRDPLVAAFNTLPADERCIMLAFIILGRNKIALARLLGVSFPVLSDILWRIQVVVAERYEQSRREEEEDGIFMF